MDHLPALLATLGAPMLIGVVGCSGSSEDLRAEVTNPAPTGPDGASETSAASDAAAPTAATDASLTPNVATDAGAPPSVPSDAGESDAGDTGRVVDASKTADVSSPSAVTFATVFSTVLNPVCSTCHGGADGIAGMDFTSSSSAYASLVRVPAGGLGSACGASGLVRVLPGSSARSLLYLKVTGTQPCGVRMPASGGPLTDAAIQAIENWIDEGAPDD
jgi:hypothetical protein